ncbi:MAG: hypothetical protein M1498_03430 [Candidatus Thermoplasmatota archaeon]|nr:hypothetical protein [Candidatus Thermoplasmatota archaeon]MCL5889207.1 hypothetical protein [Candidatus Thermoplasmatota archaeon]
MSNRKNIVDIFQLFLIVTSFLLPFFPDNSYIEAKRRPPNPQIKPPKRGYRINTRIEGSEVIEPKTTDIFRELDSGYRRYMDKSERKPNRNPYRSDHFFAIIERGIAAITR